jgi:hypothetical protein
MLVPDAPAVLHSSDFQEKDTYISIQNSGAAEVLDEVQAQDRRALLPIYQLHHRQPFVMFLTQRRRERATDLPQVDGRVPADAYVPGQAKASTWSTKHSHQRKLVMRGNAHGRL